MKNISISIVHEVYTHVTVSTKDYCKIIHRDSTGTSTDTIRAGTSSLRSSLGTFFVPAPDHAKNFH